MGKVLCGVAKIDHTTTAIIKGPGVNAGGHLKEICPVLAALNRHSSLEFAIDIEHLSRVGNVDHRSITGYRNGFLDSTEFHADVNTKGVASTGLDSFTDDRLEAR